MSGPLQQFVAAGESIAAAVENLDRYLSSDPRTRADAMAWRAIIAAANDEPAVAQQAARAARDLDADVADRLAAIGREPFRKLGH